MTVESDERPIEVLLVEDDPEDVRLTEETLNGASREPRHRAQARTGLAGHHFPSR